jgi:hypothetical protein
MQTKNYKFIIDLSFKKYEAFLIIYKWIPYNEKR